jgi:Tol biopolymer transport system component
LESAEKDVIQARNLAETVRRKRRKKLRTKLFVAAFIFAFLMVGSTAAVIHFVRAHLRTSDQGPSLLLQEKPLTTLKGSEHNPTFSPDGSLVAFSWDGGTRGNSAIYLQPLNGTIPSSPLSHGNGSDFSPTWSPDGQLIAFVRNPGEHGAVFVVAPTGGTEERVTDLNGTAIAWFPDKGRSDRLVLADGRYRADGYGLYSVDLITKQKRLLKSLPINKGIGCSDQVAFSPDGAYVAYINNCDLWVAAVHHSDSGTEIGEPFRLTIETRELNGFAWLPNSQEIVYSAKPETSIALLRISVAAGVKPKVIENFGQGATNPSISHLANGSTRLVFEKASSSANIVRTNVTVGAERPDTQSSVSLTVDDDYICSATRLDHRPCLIAPSTQADLNPKLSPDAQRIVFASTRSGSWEIYLCNADGSAIQQVTRLKAFTGSPRWSPDGRRIAFDSTVDDNLNLFKRSSYNREIFWMDVDGGKINRLTDSTSEEARPSWSRNGEWIYFMSNRTGRPEIWKTRVTTGETLQITRNGGFEAYESFDGKLIYYVKSHEAKGVWQIPVNGGEEKLFWDAVREGVWDLSRTGIYFIDYESASSDGFKALRFINFDTKEIIELGKIKSRSIEHPIGLSVLESQRIVLLVQQGPVYSDLFYIEGALFN